ncbi:MAG: O-antigen ligase family protein [Pseudonocardia sp.]|nr:O-antigen ligase family protein [Pseudonocardia sp.]
MTSLLVIRGPADLPIGDFAIAAAGLLAAVSLARTQLRVPGALRVAGGLIVVGALIASTVSTDPVGSLGVGLRLTYTVLVVPWILMTLLTEQRHVVRAVQWWLAGAALCAAGALLQFVLGDVIPGGAITADSRFTGFTTHPNDLAGIAVMAAAAALGGAFQPLLRRWRHIAVGTLAVAVMGLLMSGSVSGLLAMCAVVLFLIVRGAIKPGRALILGVAVSIVIGGAVILMKSAGALGPLQRLLQTTGQTGVSAESNTAGTRLELAERAVGAIIARPVTGHGLVTEDNILLGTFTVHNNFLAAWHAGGVLVFLGVVIASAIGVRYCLRRVSPDPLLTTVTAAVVAALAFAQTAPGTFNRYYWLPIAFAIVLSVRSRADLSSAAQKPEYGSSSISRGAASGAV